MIVRLYNLPLEVDENPADLARRIAHLLDVEIQSAGIKIVRRSIDARRKKPRYIFTVDVDVDEDARDIETRLRNVRHEFPQSAPAGDITPGNEPPGGRPIIIGAGPAGLFAALTLAAHGYRPLVFERGAPVEKRIEDVRAFWDSHAINEESNTLFGEGGAGAFSDGKLYTGGRNPRSASVLDTFVECGAPEEITYDARPHVGTDRLRAVLVNLRRKIEGLGGEFRFHSRVEKIEKGNGEAKVATKADSFASRAVVVAIGHSARDTYEMLRDCGAALERKAFQMGLRIEQPQSLINKKQYGGQHDHPRLPAAEYRLVCKASGHRRTVYTFCMCPGGMIIPSCSEAEHLCTNGMSEYARISPTANSALVVPIGTEDFRSAGRDAEDALAGIAYQRAWEKKAFTAGGGQYAAPAQRVEDFLKKQKSAGKIDCSYPLGTTGANLHEVAPKFVADSIAAALSFFDKKIPGFARGPAVLAGVETRVSSPVRIVRSRDTRRSITVPYLYPVGEGAGYAGGIVSSAIDGMKSAEAIIRRFRKC